MKKYIPYLILLALVLIDAAGDAFRLRGLQILSHSMEVVHIGGWIAIWALFEFRSKYILMYILGRVMLFDITFNLVAGLPIGYIGDSSLYDMIISWFGDLVKNPAGHFIFIFRFMALLSWVGLLTKER